MPPRSAKGKGVARTSEPAAPTGKLSLPQYLTYLTSGPSNRNASALTMKQAIQVASKLYQKYNSPESLASLSQATMIQLGLDDEAVRKAIVALADAKGKGKGTKRKWGSDLDRPLPNSKPVHVQTNLDFEEILYDETLMIKSVVVNRAPVMAAWACVVAERLNFNRQEALSIAQAYTDLNATSKGVSLGIYDQSANNTVNSAGPSQPNVSLLGRRVPVLSLQDGAWRGISSGAVREPGEAFDYIKRSFRQQMGAVIGAMRLLSLSYSPEDLNEKGYQLYIEFRPEGSGWGEKTEMLCKTILNLRKLEAPEDGDAKPVKKEENTDDDQIVSGVVHVPEGDADTVVKDEEGLERRSDKRIKVEGALDEADPFDAALDDDLDLSALDEKGF